MDRKNEKVMTLGIFAHANAGKTTITEHLLYHANIIENIGRVDYGNTITDNLKVEQQRGITVRDSIVSFQIDNIKIQLIDTPGHVDFSAEVERAINVLDGAVLVISGVEGLEAQTYVLWRTLKEKNVPVIIFINKMDRNGSNYDKVISELKNNLNVPTLPLTHVYRKNDDSLSIIASKKSEIIEELSKVDEDILEKYIKDEEISSEYLTKKTVDLVHKGSIHPIIGGSALIDVGINELLEAIAKYLPTTSKNIEVEMTAYVFMIRIDEKRGKDAYIKVLKGCINNRDTVKLGDEKTEKIKNIMISDGIKMKNVNTIYSGDIAIINGLDVQSGQIIGNSDETNKYISFVNPLLTMEIKAIDNKDTIPLMNALKILNEEDPYLNIRFNNKTNSIYCSLMGEVQAQIIKTILEERFNIKVIIENPIVIYKEIPTISASAKASYTCVSGVEFEVSPLKRGSGFRYVSKLSTDFLHLKYQRQIERLIKYYSKQGLNGWELTDMEVSLIGGQFDSMGSTPLHFNIAAPLALFRCLKMANVKLLEPIIDYIITFPEEYLSSVIKLISSKEGLYKIINTFNEEITIEGEAPFAKMMNFPLELSKNTGGRGTYTFYISKYEISKSQWSKMDYIGADPRNETTFVINDMKASLEALDETLMKKKKEKRSKFARTQKEKDLKKFLKGK